MLTNLATILTSILRSLFISIVMLVVGLSVITGQFPPDLDRLSKTYDSLQDMTQLSREIYDQKKTMDAEQAAVGSVEEDDIRKLEELNIKRAELGANLLPHRSSKDSESDIVGNVKTKSELEGRVKELQRDLFRLQERVNRLESAQRGDGT